MESEHHLPSPQGQRTLAAIVFSDVVNFSRRMSTDEDHTLQLMQRDTDLMTRCCQQFEGRVLKSTGDGLLMYFTSAVQAVACALEIQKSIAAAAESLLSEDVLQHRIGIHLGDVFVSATDVMGDGVNIAARLQSEADPGGICLSQIVYDVVKKRLALKATYLGPRELKNIQESVPVYQILLDAHSQTVGVPLQEAVQEVASAPAILASSLAKENSTPLLELDAEFRQQLEHFLAEAIGPIAPIILSRTLQRVQTPDALIDALVEQVPPAQQAEFQGQADTLLQSMIATKTTALPHQGTVAQGTSVPGSPDPEIDPAFVKRCEQELANQIGPIAAVLVKRTLAKTPLLSQRDLVEALSQHLSNPEVRESFCQRLLILS